MVDIKEVVKSLVVEDKIRGVDRATFKAIAENFGAKEEVDYASVQKNFNKLNLVNTLMTMGASQDVLNAVVNGKKEEKTEVVEEETTEE